MHNIVRRSVSLPAHFTTVTSCIPAHWLKYSTAWHGMFSRWDADRDGVLTNAEYGQGVYNSYDRDKSGDWNEGGYNRFRDDSGDEGWFAVQRREASTLCSAAAPCSGA